MQSFNQTGLEVAWIPGQIDYPQHSLTVVVKGTFRLQPDGIAAPVDAGEALLVDGDRHIGDDPEKSLEYATDFAFYKPNTDVMLKGRCYTPNSEPLTLCKVSFGLEDHLYSLYVFGDRHWENALLGGKKFTDPESFTEMPLCYENSFGGEGFAANPVGKGYKNDSLPNIVHPDFLIHSPDDRPQPVGFAPVHSLWQPRQAKMGTFDKKWDEQRWPWFPQDLDWSLFNAAAPALQRPGFLNGNETLVMENLHRSVPMYRCKLPMLRSRCFINKGDEHRVADFNEVPLKLDTLWVDAEEELLVLIWRGTTAIKDRFHDELKHLLLVTEPLESTPEPEEVYREQLAQILAPPQPEEIAPPGQESEPPPKQEMNVDAEVKKALDDARAALKGMNLPEATVAVLNQEQNPTVFLDLLLKALGVDPDAAAKFQHETLLANRKLLDDRGYDPNLAGRLSAEKVTSREDVIRLYAEGRDFYGIDMSNLDLHGLDLHDARFSHTLLFSANLNKCNLTGANLSHATLDGADLVGATLEGVNLEHATLRNAKLVKASLKSALLNESRFDAADLTQVDLCQSQLVRARLDSCVLAQANLAGADLGDAHLVKADLSGANLSECNASKADFSQATLDDANLSSVDLTQASLKQASLKRANLSAAILNGARFTQANLENATITRVQAGGAVLDDAIMTRAVLDDADFSAASLKQVTLTGASLRSTLFRAASLEQARLDEADGERADFTSAQLVSADLQKGRFSEADFSSADLSWAGFEQARLSHARFTGTLATHANLRQADLSELIAGGGANFDHANLEQVSANGSIWMQSSLREANLMWADMHRCNLNQADMSRAYCVAADLKQSDLTRANLKDADFSDCNLFECQLESATITGTKFIGSNLYSAFFHDNFAAEAKIQKSDFLNANLKRTRLALWGETD